MDDKNRLFQEVCLRQIQLILTVALGVSEIRWARLLDGGLFNTGLWEGNVLLDRDTHAILALIDGDRAVYGDPEKLKKLNREQKEALRKFSETLKEHNYKERRSFFEKFKK